MNTKSKYKILILLLAALALPLSWANAQTAPYYQFNGSSLNTVGGSPTTISGTIGSTITISLQVAWPTLATDSGGIDYWLTQLAGPTAGAFSITGMDYTGSTFSANTTSQATFTTDTRSNSIGTTATPDGIPDNQLNPRNAWNLGLGTSDGLGIAAGTYQVVNITLAISGAAAPGTYTLATFDYSGFGIHDTTPTRQAEIFVTVVPEPATWSLFGLGGLGAFGLNLLRARRKY